MRRALAHSVKWDGVTRLQAAKRLLACVDQQAAESARRLCSPGSLPEARRFPKAAARDRQLMAEAV